MRADLFRFCLVRRGCVDWFLSPFTLRGSLREEHDIQARGSRAVGQETSIGILSIVVVTGIMEWFPRWRQGERSAANNMAIAMASGPPESAGPTPEPRRA
jgi:hypothetical protein